MPKVAKLTFEALLGDVPAATFLNEETAVKRRSAGIAIRSDKRINVVMIKFLSVMLFVIFISFYRIELASVTNVEAAEHFVVFKS